MKPKQKILHTFLRADIYRVLALGFGQPTRKNLEELKDILDDLISSTPAEFFPSPLLPLLQELARHLAQTTHPMLEQEYAPLFETKVLCPPSEGSYQRIERGPILGDVTAFYKAFQLNFLTQEGPPDSLKMELGFLSYMALKEAFAIQENLRTEAQTTFDGQRKFLLDHLGNWGPLFAQRLQSVAENPCYKTLGVLLTRWLEAENRHFQIKPEALSFSPADLPSLPVF